MGMRSNGSGNTEGHGFSLAGKHQKPVGLH